MKPFKVKIIEQTQVQMFFKRHAFYHFMLYIHTSKLLPALLVVEGKVRLLLTLAVFLQNLD